MQTKRVFKRIETCLAVGDMAVGAENRNMSGRESYEPDMAVGAHLGPFDGTGEGSELEEAVVSVPVAQHAHASEMPDACPPS